MGMLRAPVVSMWSENPSRTWIWLASAALACGGRTDALTDPGAEPPAGATPKATTVPVQTSPAPDVAIREPAPVSQGNVPAADIPGVGDPGPPCNLSVPDTREAYQPPAACAAPESGLLRMANGLEELDRLLPGQWLTCSFPTQFRTSDEIGFEITQDQRWYKLYPDGHGGVRRGTDPSQQGTLTASASLGYAQVDLNTSEGFMPTLPEFSLTPAKLRFPDELLSTYVKNDGYGRCSSAPAPRSTGGAFPPPAACAQVGAGTNSIESIEGAHSALQGRWLSCEGSLFGTKDDVGLEIAADGRFYKIYVDASGVVYRGQGFDREGTYELLDLGDRVQLNLMLAGRGTFILQPIYHSSPRSVELDNYGIFGGNYVFDAVQ